MPTNTGEAREIKDRASANEAEIVRESKTLARKVKANLKREDNEPAVVAGTKSQSKRRRAQT